MKFVCYKHNEIYTAACQGCMFDEPARLMMFVLPKGSVMCKGFKSFCGGGAGAQDGKGHGGTSHSAGAAGATYFVAASGDNNVRQFAAQGEAGCGQHRVAMSAACADCWRDFYGIKSPSLMFNIAPADTEQSVRCRCRPELPATWYCASGKCGADEQDDEALPFDASADDDAVGAGPHLVCSEHGWFVADHSDDCAACRAAEAVWDSILSSPFSGDDNRPPLDIPLSRSPLDGWICPWCSRGISPDCDVCPVCSEERTGRI